MFVQPINTPLAINFPAVDPNGDPLTYTLGTAQGSYLFHINTSPSPHLETSSVIVYAALGQTTYNFREFLLTQSCGDILY